MPPSAEHPNKRPQLARVSAACDLCKSRKVKCDGNRPCAYCRRKDRATTCTFSGPKPRQTQQHRASTDTSTEPPRATREQPSSSTAAEGTGGVTTSYRLSQRLQGDDHARLGAELTPTVSREDNHEDTDVPLEARLLRDAQGKTIFIGDCAPISFLQTVRHLIASKVDPEGFPAQASVEFTNSRTAEHDEDRSTPFVRAEEANTLVSGYLVATCGLVELFERETLSTNVRSLSSSGPPRDSIATAVYYLVAAIGALEADEPRADQWFTQARDVLQANLCSNMSVATVQGYALLAVYMLRSAQPNAAYLHFSLAARTAYAIGLHRTEVNASFASDRAMRDRIWKSLRVIDMLISNLLGRPPSTSDVDCTVTYNTAEPSTSNSQSYIIDASVQIFMIMERIVVEVYSRKRISLRLALYISRQLKRWASSWFGQFMDVVASTDRGWETHVKIGACQTLCSYFYAIMLLTRPFLIYDLYEYMGASMRVVGTRAESQEKRKFADAALEAAASFVNMLKTVVRSGSMPHRMPLVVSWLLTASLVLAVGGLGRSGLAFEDDCRTSIDCMEYFGTLDPHARQYSVILRALLKKTTDYVKQREHDLRSQRRQAGVQLFGLLPFGTDSYGNAQDKIAPDEGDHVSSTMVEQETQTAGASSDWTMYDADFFALPWNQENDLGLQDFLQPGRQTLEGSLADIPLFPMYDQLFWS